MLQKALVPVLAAAAPAGGELGLVILAAARASPWRGARNGPDAVANQRSGSLGFCVIEDPDLGRRVEHRQVADPAAELAVLDQTRDARVVEQILEVRRVGQRAATPNALHVRGAFMAEL